MGNVKSMTLAYDVDVMDELKRVTGQTTIKGAIEDAVKFRIRHEKVRQ